MTVGSSNSARPLKSTTGPRSRFVADFIGQINLFAARPQGREDGWDVLSIAGSTVRTAATAGLNGQPVTVGVRPEQLAIVLGKSAPPPGFQCAAGQGAEPPISPAA